VVKGWVLEISYLDEIASTHLYLVDAVKSGEVKPPYALSAEKQYGGVGSRGNAWEGMEGNLFLSFCMSTESLVPDLPRQSMSIYFSFLLKETLSEFGSKVWLKWPNDFYIGDKKAGGTITAVLKGNIVVCSIGLNLLKAPPEYATIDIKVEKKELLESYFLKIKRHIFWKDIFRKYKVEFLQSTGFQYFDSAAQKKLLLKDAVLQNDGSIIVENRRVYSLR
jgi:BirA family biotin operon repressor/biotin-[acetyl-CoA-carboxylase] ligase